MKKNIYILLVGFFSCTISQNETPPVPDPQPGSEVRALLNTPLQNSPGQIELVDSYQADENGIHFRNFYFYNSQNQLVLTVSKYIGGHRGGDWLFVPGDTVAASIFSYDGARLVKKKGFDFKNSIFVYTSEINYTYDSLGRLFQMKNGSDGALITHHYDDSGQLQFKRYGKNQAKEYDEFRYDELGRISAHLYWGGGEAPIFVRNYRYNDLGQLEAKEERVLGGGWEDAFVYSYDALGKVIKEEEFDLAFGQQLFSTRVYTYSQ